MTKFYVWIDNPEQQILTSTEFNADTERVRGFSSGETISSKKMNTALRQSSLITVALMEALNISDNIDVASTLIDVKNEIVSKLSAFTKNIANTESNASILITTGSGDKYLADNGYYKPINIPTVDSELSLTSANAVENKVVTENLNKKLESKDIATINGQTITAGGNITIESGETVTVDSELSLDSENPVQNKVITEALNGKLRKPTADDMPIGGTMHLLGVERGNLDGEIWCAANPKYIYSAGTLVDGKTVPIIPVYKVAGQPFANMSEETLANTPNTIFVATPQLPWEAANKKYVDDLATTKVTRSNVTYRAVYARYNSEDTTIPMANATNVITNNNLNGCIPFYINDVNGNHLRVNTPDKDVDAANKKYVDDNKGTKLYKHTWLVNCKNPNTNTEYVVNIHFYAVSQNVELKYSDEYEIAIVATDIINAPYIEMDGNGKVTTAISQFGDHVPCYDFNIHDALPDQDAIIISIEPQYVGV